MLGGHMKCYSSVVNIFILKGHTFPYLVRNDWYLVKNIRLPSRCTSHSRGGDYSTLVLLWVVLYALCHKKAENILKKNKILRFTPGTGGLKIVKPHYNPKNLNHCMGVFDSSNEASGCTDHNAKNLNSLQCAVAEKIKKKTKKFREKKFKNNRFWWFSWFFQQRYIFRSWVFFAL